MRTRTEPRPGRTYILDDFTVAQVLKVEDGAVVYRTRSRSWFLQRRVAVRRRGVAWLTQRIRAEVNGEFFPDVALPGLHRFERPKREVADLKAHLTDGTTRWPFARKS